MKSTRLALYATSFILAVLPLRAAAQDPSIFPLGRKAPNIHHTGDVWLNELSEADSVFDYNVTIATFAPGAKLDWHVHPGGQILLITQGTGYYQERGEEKRVVQNGDVIKCLPGTEHWHAATPTSHFAYVGLTMNHPDGRTLWMDSVTDEEYSQGHSADATSAAVEQELLSLSRGKWRWMAERDMDALEALFHEEAVFVHMGGTMSRDRELDVIRSGGIHYKHAEIQEMSVRVIGMTAIVLNTIRLDAVVGGNEVTNPFEVTEVYVQQDGMWKLALLSFTRLLR